MSRLLSEIQRRNLPRMSALYAGSSWMLFGVAETVLPVFDVPNWVLQALFVTSVVGFPVFAVAVWFIGGRAGGGTAAETPADAADRLEFGRRLNIAIIAVLSIAVILLLADRFVPHDGSGRNSVPSIAVLPLKNIGAEADAFSDGLSEELIGVLSQVRGLRVLARGSSFRFRDAELPPGEIGKQLGVAYLLEGSVRRVEQRIRVHIGLIDVAAGDSIWARTFDRELRDVFEVQTEIGRLVAEQLRVSIVGEALRAPARPSNENLAAYNAYQQGLFHANRGDPDNLTKAIAFFDDALKQDPAYAIAAASASSSLTSLAKTQPPGTARDQHWRQAEVRALEAIDLAPDIAAGHAALSYFLSQGPLADQPGAEKSARRALDLDPSNSSALNMLGIALLYQGKMADAITAFDRAVAVNPLNFNAQFSRAGVLARAGRLDDAEAAYRRCIELQPERMLTRAFLTQILVHRKQAEAALAIAQAEPNAAWRQYALALVHEGRGARADSETALQAFIATNGESDPFNVGQVYALRGDADRAFEWLDRAIAAHDPGVADLDLDWYYGALKQDPRYAEAHRITASHATHPPS